MTAWVAALLACLCLTSYAATHATRWRNRNISTYRLSVTQTALLATVLATAITGLVTAHLQEPHADAAFGLAAALWLSLFATSTDIKCKKLPWDLCYAAAACGAAAGCGDFVASRHHPVASMSLTIAASFLLLVCVPFLARLITRRGLGMSDIRMLLTFVCAESWLVGYTALAVALIAACALQLPLHLLAAYQRNKRRHLGGTTDPAPNDRGSRLTLPFAPALAATNLLAVVLAAH